MVCLGNICRSPLAEGILRRKIQEAGVNWQVDSAGTGSWHIGHAPDPRSIHIAAKHGLDITNQRGRQFTLEDFEHFDLILVMDNENLKNVLSLARNDADRQKVDLIRNLVTPNTNEPVPDPYWNDDGFQQVYDMLEQACEFLIQKHT